MRKLSLLCICLFALPFALFANEVASPVETTLLSEVDAIRPGEPFWVAVQLDLEEGWHAYWKNPGANGFPTEVKWNLPEGYQVGELKWPYPEMIELQEQLAYTYHGQLLLMAEVIPPSELAEDQMQEISATVSWLVCSDSECLPGEAKVTVELPVSDKLVASRATLHSFRKARRRIPLALPDVLVETKDQELVLHLDISSRYSKVYFYPEMSGVVEEGSELAVHENGKSFSMGLKDISALNDSSMKGLLVLADEAGHPGTVFEIDANPNAKAAAGFGDQSFWMALLFAFLGGVILNLMPCVLPVLSLKVFSLVKLSGESRFKILRHGLFFTAGVLISFWTLAGGLLILRASGAIVGWGFQLQEPIFVALLASLIFIFALSLFGVFELGTSVSAWAGQKESDTKKGGNDSLGAFMSGVLATAVATPCTGPFLGSAVGFAVTLPALPAMMIFTALGLGMAAPFLLISLFPALVRFFPRPGNWMITFKEIMGFCMMATVVWLVWVFGMQTGASALSLFLGALLLFSLAFWVFGKWSTPIKKPRVRYASYVVTLLLSCLSFYTIVKATHLPSQDNFELVAMLDVEEMQKNPTQWVPFSKEKLEELRAKKIPVLIDFTASWCLTCQTNFGVLETSEVKQALKDAGVVKMLADWTKNDPEITAELKKHGRSSVPLYVLYGPNGEEEILPQLLTKGVVIDALQKIEQ